MHRAMPKKTHIHIPSIARSISNINLARSFFNLFFLHCSCLDPRPENRLM